MKQKTKDKIFHCTVAALMAVIFTCACLCLSGCAVIETAFDIIEIFDDEPVEPSETVITLTADDGTKFEIKEVE
jgi:hypothetical protein